RPLSPSRGIRRVVPAIRRGWMFFRRGSFRVRSPPSGESVMKFQRLLIALTVVNLGLLIFLLSQIRPVLRGPVLRGRELEIIDDRGRVRASIKVQPVNKKFKLTNGERY